MKGKEKHHLTINRGGEYKTGHTGVNDRNEDEIDGLEEPRAKDGKRGLLKYHHLPRVVRLLVELGKEPGG